MTCANAQNIELSKEKIEGEKKKISMLGLNTTILMPP
jgi:hypothetical protein